MLSVRAMARLALCVAAVALAACAGQPAPLQPEPVLLSTQQEVALGRRTQRGILDAVGEYRDAQLQAYVTRIGLRLAAVSGRPDLPWSFTVLDDPSSGAFALPGGFVYLTRGILADMGSEAELAAVLAHLIGHVAARQSAVPLTPTEIADLGLAADRLLASGIGADDGAPGSGLGTLFRRFSHANEREADDLAFRYLGRAGYDAHALVTILQVLDTAGQGASTGRLPGWLASHPDPSDRLARLEIEIEAEPEELRGTAVGRKAFLAHIDGLVFGDDPRQGFFDGETFYEPRLAFRITLPSGWSTSHQRRSVGAVSPRQDAVVAVSSVTAASPASAARRFFARRGVEQGSSWRSSIGGLPAVASAFQIAGSPSAPVAGLVAYVPCGKCRDGQVLQLLAYSLADHLQRFQKVLETSLESFAPLTDSRYLDVRPRRIALVPVPRETPLEDLLRSHPSSEPFDTLLLLNHLGPGQSLAAGTRAKIVVGPPPP